jgi:hypothetical protein
MFATLHHSCEQEMENIFNDVNSVLMVYTFCVIVWRTQIYIQLTAQYIHTSTQYSAFVHGVDTEQLRETFLPSASSQTKEKSAITKLVDTSFYITFDTLFTL